MPLALGVDFIVQTVVKAPAILCLSLASYHHTLKFRTYTAGATPFWGYVCGQITATVKSEE